MSSGEPLHRRSVGGIDDTDAVPGGFVFPDVADIQAAVGQERGMQVGVGVESG
jgi:hypothetical protein